jgi:hypothetical protein
MKKYLLILVLIFFTTIIFAQRVALYNVEDKAQVFVYTMPVGTIIFEVDSLKMYRLTAKFVGTDNMNDVFTAGSYEVVNDQNKTGTLRFSKEILAKNENDVKIGFTLNATALVFYNGNVIQNSQWSGVSTNIIHLNFETQTYDYLIIKK